MRGAIGVWLLLFAMLALAGQAPAGAQEVKLATWNLEWLTLRAAGDPALPADVVPKRAEDIAALRAYAARLDADVVAIEEVDGAAAAAEIFPPERYAVHMTADHVVQRVGFAVRRGIPVVPHPDLVALDVYPPAAPAHLRSGADITLDLPGGMLRLLAVHLKAGCRSDPFASSRRPACRVLAAQSRVMQAWVAARAEAGEAFAVLGDFNHLAAADDDVATTLEAAAPLIEPTADHASPCRRGGERFIDRILLGGAARNWLEPESLRVLVYHEPGQIAGRHLSDHCPVSVRLHLGDGS